MYTLYYSPGACSLAVHAVLAALNVPYTAELARVNGEKTQELLKANPRGTVPTLVEGKEVFREGAAILIYLLDKHDNGSLLPKEGAARARALEWLMFANSDLHPAYGQIFYAKKKGAEADDVGVARACGRIQELWDDVEAQLLKSKFLAGESITVGDILVAVIANWNNGIPMPAQLGERTKKMLQAVSAHPAFAKAVQDEGVEYKAAA